MRRRRADLGGLALGMLPVDVVLELGAVCEDQVTERADERAGGDHERLLTVRTFVEPDEGLAALPARH
jgi:hypothetical protein